MTRITPLTEGEFLDAVIQLATFLGWESAHFRPARTQRGWRTPVQGTMGKGWPDLILVRERDKRTMFIELKTDKGVVSPEQHRVLALLEAAGQHADVWTPRHLDNGRIMQDLR